MMISTGTTQRQLVFGEEEGVENLFIDWKSLLDRSTESSEFNTLIWKVIKYWHHPQVAGVWVGEVGGGPVHKGEELARQIHEDQ